MTATVAPPVGEPLRRCKRCGFLAYRFRPCRTCELLGEPIPDPIPEQPVRLRPHPDAARHRDELRSAS